MYRRKDVNSKRHHNSGPQIFWCPYFEEDSFIAFYIDQLSGIGRILAIGNELSRPEDQNMHICQGTGYKKLANEQLEEVTLIYCARRSLLSKCFYLEICCWYITVNCMSSGRLRSTFLSNRYEV